MTTLFGNLFPALLRRKENGEETDHDEAPPSANQGDSNEATDKKKRLPILLIPGFMSSGLRIDSSDLEPDWVGDQLWLDLTRLGLATAKKGSSSLVGLGNTVAKDHWISHLMLQPENRALEPEGVRVRAIPGLAGIDYLDHTSSFSKLVSYVFGPLIQVLKREGYRDGVDLDAASYDWRLPPSELERRDGYFSNTIQLVERLVQTNHHTPVVLLCHSMGCKVGHYFLNFCLEQKGRAWIDAHVHTFFVVGAPHLGASNTIRGLICGDKMGLDAFLSEQDAVRLGRSWGSVHWLMPKELPMGAPPVAYIRPTGRISISPVWPTDYLTILNHNSTREIELCVLFLGRVLIQSFRSENGRVESGTFSFSTHPENPGVEGTNSKPFFQLMVLSPTHDNTREQDCLIRAATCPARACCALPWEEWFRCLVPRQYLVTKQLVAQVIDQSAIIASTGPIDLSALFPDNKGGSLTQTFDLHQAPFYWMKSSGQPKLQAIRLEIQWQPFTDGSQTPPAVVAQVHPDTPEDVRNSPTKPYQPVHPYRFSQEEGAEKEARAIHRRLEEDPYDPRGRSSWDKPPVRKVKAIYGINLPTEVGACYTTRPAVVATPGAANQSLCVVDESAEISSGAKENGYRLRNGILEETKDTRYRVRNNCDGSWEERRGSGDGTVPLWSLQHAQTWHGADCQVEVNELEKADHREILADERFHRIVLDYCVSSG